MGPASLLTNSLCIGNPALAGQHPLPIDKKEGRAMLFHTPPTEYIEIRSQVYFTSSGQFPPLSNFFKVNLCDRKHHLFLKPSV